VEVHLEKDRWAGKEGRAVLGSVLGIWFGKLSGTFVFFTLPHLARLVGCLQENGSGETGFRISYVF
jgi:hypothetical protein